MAIGAPATWIESVGLPVDTPTPPNSVGRHYLLVETQTNAAARSTYRHSAYRILNEGGLRYGSQVSIAFDPAYEELTLHRLCLVRGNEVIDRLDRGKIQVLQRESDLEYLVYNGELSAVIILNDVRVGDVVELAYTKTGTNPVFGNHFVDELPLDWGIPVAHLRHRIIQPPDHSLSHRTIGSSSLRVRETRTAAGTELIWEGHDLPAAVYDNNIPAWYPANPVVQVTDFPSWRSVVEWALPLYADPEAASAAVHTTAANLGPNASPLERATLALQFVQRDIRYLGLEQGVGSHRPSPAGDVLARRFGDCKDKARLLVSLLREMGISAAPVLVHTTHRQAVADRLPSPLDFNHVIVLVRVSGEDFLVDPTLSYQGGGLRQRHTTRYRTGLVIDPATTSLARWPESENDIKRILVDETFSISAIQGGTTLDVRSMYHGRSAEDMRAYLAGTTRDDLGKAYTDFYARYYPDVALKAPVTWTDDSNSNTLTVSEQYSIQRIFVPQADPAMLKAEFFPTALNGYTDSPGAAGRTTPLAIAHPVDISTRTRVLLPELWSVKPETIRVTDPAFTFSFSVSGKGREIEWAYYWRSRADHLQPADFVAHSRNLARVNDTLGYKLTYNTAAAARTGFNTNWAMIALAGFTAAGSAFGAHRVWRIRQPPQPPPLPGYDRDQLTGLGGWLILVAFGVVARPIVILSTIVSTFGAYVNLDSWHLLTSVDSPSYQRHFALIAPTEMVLNVVLLIGTLLLAALFFGRRRTFPRLMIIFLVVQLATAIFEVWAMQALATSAATDRAQTYRDLFQTAVAAAIWIPYFFVSRRVKLTFTR